jgi:hypothetical protein
MTEEEQATTQGKWFLAWWGILPTHLFTGNSKGSRQEAWLEWKKLSPDRDLCKKIGEYTKEREQAWNQLKSTGDTVPKWKQAVRLLKYQFWQDELPKLKYKRSPGAANLCKCGSEVEHGGYGCCWRCYDNLHGNKLAGWT